MKVLVIAILYAVVTLCLGSFAHASELKLSVVSYHDHVIRTGVEAPVGEQRACVMYLEGLGDSIRNHQRLFDALSSAGYRVLAFDYYGQGGSSGDMNETRAEYHNGKYPDIKESAEDMWSIIGGKACATSPHLVIGWSTGGLSAYLLSNEQWTDGVVLIAPGIAPRKEVGEASGHLSMFAPDGLEADGFHYPQIITLRTLTRAVEPGVHVDPIKPNTPMKVRDFAENLMFTAWLARDDDIETTQRGLVFLSGDNDTYVDAKLTRQTLKERAPSFEVVQYAGALHELDNEIEPVRRDLVERTIRFFNSIAK